MSVFPMVTKKQSDRSGYGKIVSNGSRLLVKPARLFRASDLREVLLVSLSALTTLTCPVDRWSKVSDQFYRLNRGQNSDRFRKFCHRVEAFFGSEADDVFSAELWRAWHNAHHRRRMLIVGKRFRKYYRVDVHFCGRSGLEAALRTGAGVILWFDNFVHHSVVGKYPFSEAGFVSYQLSSTDHGFSRSRFGRLFLNQIPLSVESGLVARRIVFDGASALAATREVKALLAENSIVRITNNAFIGRRFVRVPFGAAAWLSVATTPLNLARSTGAALLPVSVIEKVPLRQYDVTIGSPIVVDTGDKRRAFLKASLDYAGYLEPLVRSHPAQWITWSSAIEEAPGC